MRQAFYVKQWTFLTNGIGINELLNVKKKKYSKNRRSDSYFIRLRKKNTNKCTWSTSKDTR